MFSISLEKVVFQLNYKGYFELIYYVFSLSASEKKRELGE